MPSDEVKLCLLKKSDKTESGFELTDDEFYISAEAYNQDKLIHFSSFTDKNGRLLKEGDRIKTSEGYKGTVVLNDLAQWVVGWDDRDVGYLSKILCTMTVECIGNIYLPKGE